MNQLITLTAVALVALASSAAAMTRDTSVNSSTIRGYAPAGINVSQLSDRTILMLLNTIHGGGSESEKRQAVRATLMHDESRVSSMSRGHNAVARQIFSQISAAEDGPDRN